MDLQVLSETERRLLEMRFPEDFDSSEPRASLAVVAETLNISRDEARRLESRVLQKLCVWIIESN